MAHSVLDQRAYDSDRVISGQSPGTLHMPEPEPTLKREWEDIARQLAHEQDPTKVLELACKLNEALAAEEKEKKEKVDCKLRATGDANRSAA